MDIVIRRIRPGEGDRLREIRLRALRDAPSAFASTFEVEAIRHRGAWAAAADSRSAGTAAATFVAVAGTDWVGLVGAFQATEHPGVIELVSMWVAPESRRRGVGRLLVGEIVAWARGIHAESVELWVTRGNDAASALYRRSDFVLTGDCQPLPADPSQDELRMALALTDAGNARPAREREE